MKATVFGSSGRPPSTSTFPQPDAMEIAMIVVSVRRPSAEGAARDRFVPVIERDGSLYNADLDRFFLDLPLNGVRSPHSLRAYAMTSCSGLGFWRRRVASRSGTLRVRMLRPFTARVGAKMLAHGSPRIMEPLRCGFREALQWAESENLVASSPFTHRDVCGEVTQHIAPALSLATTPMSARPSTRTSASFPRRLSRLPRCRASWPDL